MSGAPSARLKVAVICGGVGAARFLLALQHHRPDVDIVGIVNVADDMVLHGLHISPDLDTITYSLAGQINTNTGWGMSNETWLAMGELRAYGEHLATSESGHDQSNSTVGSDPTGWFSLGDRDLGTHLYRTSRLAQGATLTQVTTEITGRWGLDLTLLPVTDDPVRTFLRTQDGTELSFQEYFVRERHDVDITHVEFRGITAAEMTPAVRGHLESADVICIAPSNPVVSIDPVVGIPGMGDLLRDRREHVVAISPIIGGQAIKGPAAQLLVNLGHSPTATSVANWYSDIISTLCIDNIDATLKSEIEALGVSCVVADTILQPVERAHDLITEIMALSALAR